jgi:hypothetical protein
VNKPFKVWIATGENAHHIIGISFDERKATKMSKGKGEWGADGQVYEGWAIFCDNDDSKEVYLFAWGGTSTEGPNRYKLDVDLIEYQKELKRNALSKLTLEERIALGIK